LKEQEVKQRYIQNFLMVSAAFLAINVPRVGVAAGSETLMTGTLRMAPARVEQVSNNPAAKKKDEA
jgi:hypothetical protein